MKGISWSSLKRNNFITGGGKYDGKLILWDSFSGNSEVIIRIGSQICNIFHSISNYPGYFITNLGCNRIIIWREINNKIQKVKELICHNQRIIYSTMNSRNEEIATSGNDGFIKFWNFFSRK